MQKNICFNIKLETSLHYLPMTSDTDYHATSQIYSMCKQ